MRESVVWPESFMMIPPPRPPLSSKRLEGPFPFFFGGGEKKILISFSQKCRKMVRAEPPFSPLLLQSGRKAPSSDPLLPFTGFFNSVFVFAEIPWISG